LSDSSEILFSVILVNYKVPEFLCEALKSLRHVELYERTEIIVVDNASNDHSRRLIDKEFPEVIWIQLKKNFGFGKACNIGAQSAKGKYILFLNPDTVVGADTLKSSLNFMQSHPEAGMMGPKILNSDGTLQASCRRSQPSPSIAFYHFSGLSSLFPKSKRFGRYHLTFMDPDEAAPVDAISGSFMVVPRQLFLDIGGFDERFFMYGEDLDLCWRIIEKGYKVWYNPEIQIVHRKGKSSSKQIFRSRVAFYEAMVIFSKKYKHLHRTFFPTQIIYLGIFFQASVNIAANLVRHFIALLIDMIIINTCLWAGISLRFASASASPYLYNNPTSIIGLHFLISSCFLFILSYNGIYSKNRYSISNALYSGILASVLFLATVYFWKSIALSRIAFASSTFVISVLLVLWREFATRAVRGFRYLIYSSEQVLIAGNGPIASKLIKSIEEQKKNITIIGVLWSDGPRPGEYEGYPVLGTIDDIKQTLERHQIDSIIIATSQSWYSQIIEVLSKCKKRHLTIKWVSHELFSKHSGELPAEIPLLDFTI
jgi:GT2 family glycosyltransferase